MDAVSERSEMAQNIVTTGSISSTVVLDYGTGTAHKTYEPPAWVRVLYRLAFQAPFPYTSNHAALEAARLRRRITGLLTRFWFGRNLVSPVLDIHDEDDGRRAFVTELVRGTAPRDKRRARKFLKTLTRRFLAAGLPTWQVTPHNPRSVGNLIEKSDGSYRLIDLESNLVAPLMPLSGIVGAIRQGNFPAFDDIDIERLDAYLANHQTELVEKLGNRDAGELRAATAAYARAADEWHGSERRFLTRGLRLALQLVDVPSWIRGLRRMSGGGQMKAERFVRAGIDQWVAQGHLGESEAARLRQTLRTPEVVAVTTHLGTHIAMSVPLRFPIGSLARALWTVAMRVSAEWGALRGRPVGSARQVHTLLVALVSVVPGFGAGAYLLAKPLRSNGVLAVIASDRILQKLPFRFYSRLHIVALTTWFAKTSAQRQVQRRTLSISSIALGARRRLAGLGHHWLFLGAVLGINAALLIVTAAAVGPDEGAESFADNVLAPALSNGPLVLAGLFGLLAFAAFWPAAARRANDREAAGIFFWGISGLGLLAFGIDGYFAMHDAAVRWVADHIEILLLPEAALDEAIVLGLAALSLAVLYIFRQELLARQHSSVLLSAAVVSSLAATALSLSGVAALQGATLPMHVFAVGGLLTAYAMRFREVRGVTRDVTSGAAA